MSKRIVTYPRGFQGFDIGIPVETKGDTVKDALKNASYNRDSQELRFVISNKNVETLWRQLADGNCSTNNFDIREKILCNALLAFGTTDFYEWVKLQETNPNTTDMHRRFINDTFNFIDSGDRAMSLFSWGTVIHVREVTAKDALPELRSGDFFGLSQALQHRRSSTVTDIVSRWVCREGGFQDLAGTLHILFGDTQP